VLTTSFADHQNNCFQKKTKAQTKLRLCFFRQ
jgi:hypothetical protein